MILNLLFKGKNIISAGQTNRAQPVTNLCSKQMDIAKPSKFAYLGVVEFPSLVDTMFTKE